MQDMEIMFDMKLGLIDTLRKALDEEKIHYVWFPVGRSDTRKRKRPYVLVSYTEWRNDYTNKAKVKILVGRTEGHVPSAVIHKLANVLVAIGILS